MTQIDYTSLWFGIAFGFILGVFLAWYLSYLWRQLEEHRIARAEHEEYMKNKERQDLKKEILDEVKRMMKQ